MADLTDYYREKDRRDEAVALLRPPPTDADALAWLAQMSAASFRLARTVSRRRTA